MSGKTNRLVKYEVREIYSDEAMEVATEILQGNDVFIGADNEFEVERAEESEARARSQRAGNLSGHTTGTANERKEDES